MSRESWEDAGGEEEREGAVFISLWGLVWLVKEDFRRTGSVKGSSSVGRLPFGAPPS